MLKYIDTVTIDTLCQFISKFILNITDEVEIKQVLSKIMEKIVNKKIKTFVESNIRSSGKITSIIKTLLNISQTFVSIFTPDTLSKAEQIAYDNTIRLNERYTSFLDTFIEMINYNESPDLNISRFFNSVRKITEPRIRNQYYNMFYNHLKLFQIIFLFLLYCC
jgi:hypothetical protein